MTQFPVFRGGPSAPLNPARHHAVEGIVPIGCGHVALYPGNIFVGDRDAVAVIPSAIADDVACGAAEQFRRRRVADAAALPSTYLPSEAAKAAFEQRHSGRRRG